MLPSSRMAIPKIKDFISETYTVEITPELIFTFNLRLIPGQEYNDLLDAVRELHPDGTKITIEMTAPAVILAGVATYYTSIESKSVKLTKDDVNEIWVEWADKDRWGLYNQVYAVCTRSAAADPLSGTTKSGSAVG